MNEIKFLKNILSKARSGKEFVTNFSIIANNIRERIKELEKSRAIKKTIYDLELHELLNVNNTDVRRVPGGWIYDCWDIEKDEFKTGVFVQFNNEFQIKK